MPHFHKTIVYSKSACMCFAQGHIQKHWKISKYHTCESLLTQQHCALSTFVGSLIWTKASEPNSVLTKTSHEQFLSERIRMDTTLLSPRPVTHECQTPHNHSFQLWYFLHFQLWWLQQLQKVGSVLAFNLASNKWRISSITILLIRCLSHTYSYLMCRIFQQSPLVYFKFILTDRI